MGWFIIINLIGGIGSGKTRLLHAICRRISEQDLEEGKQPVFPLMVSAQKIVDGYGSKQRLIERTLDYAVSSVVDMLPPDTRLLLLVDEYNHLSRQEQTKFAEMLLPLHDIKYFSDDASGKLRIVVASEPVDLRNNPLNMAEDIAMKPLSREEFDVLTANVPLNIAGVNSAKGQRERRELLDGIYTLSHGVPAIVKDLLEGFKPVNRYVGLPSVLDKWYKNRFADPFCEAFTSQNINGEVDLDPKRKWSEAMHVLTMGMIFSRDWWRIARKHYEHKWQFEGGLELAGRVKCAEKKIFDTIVDARLSIPYEEEEDPVSSGWRSMVTAYMLHNEPVLLLCMMKEYIELLFDYKFDIVTQKAGSEIYSRMAKRNSEEISRLMYVYSWLDTLIKDKSEGMYELNEFYSLSEDFLKKL